MHISAKRSQTAGVVLDIKDSRKHSQFIVAMDDSFFEDNDNFLPQGVKTYPAARFLREAQSFIAIRERHALETNRHYRQLLPYMVVRYLDCPDGQVRYAAYKRTAKIGEDRLVNKYSVGYGGHIDALSLVFLNGSILDLDATIRRSAKIEKDEEVRVTDRENGPLNVWFDYLDVDYANEFIVSDHEVDAYHLGIIMVLDLPFNVPVEPAEDKLENAGILTAEEVLALPGEVESWTKLYLKHVLASV